ncbi:hypothetical protein FDECE_4037 [Fusarium decemcellulare]|nr:hypothetical protein FDECE_4037 [Fusarium decemcellulare]
MGWRSGLAISTIAAALVTTINVVFLIVAFPRLDRPDGGSEGAIFDGSCKTAKKMSLWLHLAINVLGTVLLGASNYTQQVLTAPTREEIDIAHSKRQWMDIGVMSLHNLRKISGTRVIGWTLLALSSLPIHMLYNSSISFETGVNVYSVYAAKWEHLNDPDHVFYDDDLQDLKKSLNNLERLSNRECIATYGNKLLSDRADVILILDPQLSDRFNNFTLVKSTASPMAGQDDPTRAPYDWICLPYYNRGCILPPEDGRRQHLLS